ncbi:hypothetical protein GCM10027432_04320 [Lysobacter fragariae]
MGMGILEPRPRGKPRILAALRIGAQLSGGRSGRWLTSARRDDGRPSAGGGDPDEEGAAARDEKTMG